MLLNLLLRYPVAAIAVWAALYISDYYLTLVGARLYRAGAAEHLVFEGSYELTPYYQQDVDRMRRFSLRFALALVLSCVAISLVWYLSVGLLGVPWLFTFLLGALFLREAGIHLRHFRNIVLFRLALKGDGLRGRLEYSRSLVLRSSAWELLTFAGLNALLAILVHGWFFAGGAVACAVTGLQHLRLAGRAARQKPR